MPDISHNKVEEMCREKKNYLSRLFSSPPIYECPPVSFENKFKDDFWLQVSKDILSRFNKHKFYGKVVETQRNLEAQFYKRNFPMSIHSKGFVRLFKHEPPAQEKTKKKKHKEKKETYSKLRTQPPHAQQSTAKPPPNQDLEHV